MDGKKGKNKRLSSLSKNGLSKMKMQFVARERLHDVTTKSRGRGWESGKHKFCLKIDFLDCALIRLDCSNAVVLNIW